MEKLRVLVVEDEIVIRLFIINLLKSLDCDIIGAVSRADEAIAIALGQSPDIILMDIKLADSKDGVEAAREIARTKPIPVVFMSAYDLDDQLESCNIPTCLGYLVKPVLTDDLARYITMARAKKTK